MFHAVGILSRLQKDREVVESVNNRITQAAVEVSAELVRHNHRMLVRGPPLGERPPARRVRPVF